MDSNISEKIKEIAFNVLKDSRVKESEDFDLTLCDTMDSVNRVAILVAIEEEYDFIFKLKEISAWNTVAQLTSIVEKHL